MLNSVQHLAESMSYETLKQVQGDSWVFYSNLFRMNKGGDSL